LFTWYSLPEHSLSPTISANYFKSKGGGVVPSEAFCLNSFTKVV
jgi:hypothetical protein